VTTDGGRESGDGAQRDGVRRSSPTAGPSDAAANPAVPDGYQHGNEGTAADPAAHKHYPYKPPDRCIFCQEERIRELEAEHLDAMVKMHLECDRLETLAERAETELVWRREYMEAVDEPAYMKMKARAERAEARVVELEKEKAARFLSDFEKKHPGETKRVLEKAWEIQQRTGKPVQIAELADELNEAREREED